MKTESKVVLVTGATSGIGKAAAELLASKGYRVFGTGRDPASLDAPLPESDPAQRGEPVMSGQG